MATDLLNDNPQAETPDESHGFSQQATSALGPTIVAILRPLASLKLTVALLAMSIFIVLAGTMAQVDKDIWQVVDEYFRCLVAWIDLQIFFPPSFFPNKPNIPDWMVVPFPGGWLIGALMFLNLAAAHGLRFRPQASGSRLLGGLAVIGLGGLTTWLVVVSGSSSDGLQANSWITWGSVWLLFKLGLTASVVAMFNMLRQLAPKESGGVSSFEFVKSTQGLVGTASSIGLAVLTMWLWYEGEDAQLDDSSMRILWQLVKGTIAGLVLLLGCWMVFKKRAGVVLIHGGIGLMMLSELLVGMTAVESQISLLEGERANFARDIRSFELAVVESGSGDEETHAVVDGKRLVKGFVPERLDKDGKPTTASTPAGKVTHEVLPFDVQVVEYFKNADIRRVQDSDKNPATDGNGKLWILEPARASTGTDADSKVDYPAAYVKLTKRGTDEVIGTYAVSVMLSEQGQSDQVTVDGKTFDVSLRFKRYYKPYTVELLDVRKDDYIGTDTPRNYSSDIHLIDTAHGSELTYHIWMNNPLRYAGETFYQSGYHKVPLTGVEGTSLQLVTNTGWMIPYVACMIVAVGMLAHFCIALLRFLDRRTRETLPIETATGGLGLGGKALADDVSSNGRGPKNVPVRKGKSFDVDPSASKGPAWVPILAVVVMALYVGSKARQPHVGPNDFDFGEFGKLPIVADGRVKPIDTYARNTLRIISGSETYKDSDDRYQPAIRWLLDVIARPDEAKKHKAIRIDNLDVTEALGLKPRKGFKYAPSEFTDREDEKDLKFKETRFGKVAAQADQAREKGTRNLSVSDRKILEFERKFGMYDTLTFFRRTPEAEKESPEFNLLSAHRLSGALKQRKMPLVVPPRGATGEKSNANDWLPYSMANFLEPIETDEGHHGWAQKLHDLLDERFVPMLRMQAGRRDITDDQRMEVQRELKQNLDLKDWLASRYLSGTSKEEQQAKALPANPAVTAWTQILGAYEEGNAAKFNRAVAAYRAELDGRSLREVNLSRVSYEWFFNQFQPFFLASMLYAFVFLVATLSWLGWTNTLNRTAFWMTCFTLVLHTFAMISRIYISGRPPVTNLYSSAVFIGWGTVALGIILESVYRMGIGNVVASVTGFAALLIAHYLAGDGDTFVVLQAVLDTQFWLATHVTTINLGYSTTFLAGMLGVLYVLRGFFTRSLTPDVEKNLSRMIYGTLCFGIFFSFVGTVLGGLWADDSWGRFWGWDPKENGALIILLWNAVVLHARWDGMVKNRGMAVLSIAGNITTSWSWFGVNELGVGLHSYGFTEGVLMALGIFVLTQVAVIIVGCNPKSQWASFKKDAEPANA